MSFYRLTTTTAIVLILMSVFAMIQSRRLNDRDAELNAWKEAASPLRYKQLVSSHDEKVVTSVPSQVLTPADLQEYVREHAPQ